MIIADKEYKFTFLFAKRLEKELAVDDKKGFEVLVEGLIKRDIDTLISAIKILTGKNEGETLGLLEDYFYDDKKTDKLFEEFFEGMVENGFLKQKVVSLIKEMKERLKVSETISDSLTDEMDKVGAEVALKQISQNISKLEKIIRKN